MADLGQFAFSNASKQVFAPPAFMQAFLGAVAGAQGVRSGTMPNLNAFPFSAPPARRQAAAGVAAPPHTTGTPPATPQAQVGQQTLSAPPPGPDTGTTPDTTLPPEPDSPAPVGTVVGAGGTSVTLPPHGAPPGGTSDSDPPAPPPAGGGSGTPPPPPPPDPPGDYVGDGDEYASTESLPIKGTSGEIYLEPGSNDTVVELVRKTRYMPHMDLSTMYSLSGLVLDTMRRYSDGPYTLKDLARLGHPYGFDADGEGDWKPRKVPRRYRGKSIGHVRGQRGSVPTLEVVNRQRGVFAESWAARMEIMPDGIVFQWYNTAKTARGNKPLAWFLAHGTMRNGRPLMQAHGPFSAGLLRWIRVLDTEWRKAATRAWHQSQHAIALSRQLEQMEATEASA